MVDYRFRILAIGYFGYFEEPGNRVLDVFVSALVQTDTVDLGVGKRKKEGKEVSRRGSQDEPAQDKEENGS